MIYVKSIVAGLVCVCVASLLVGAIISTYLSVVYHLGPGPIGWNSNFLANPFDWFFVAAAFLVGFSWEFRRARSK
jgi:high-affinity Fe2+/Pb2+ permease